MRGSAVAVYLLFGVVGAGCMAEDSSTAEDPSPDDPDNPALDDPSSVPSSVEADMMMVPVAWDDAGCTATFGTAWRNRILPQRSAGVSIVELVAQVGGPDAVFGIANGRANGLSRLGASVRFNPDGFVDARDGTGYAAVTPFAYAYATPHAYRISITANLSTHRYDATVTDVATGASAQIADDYAFRPEQATMSRFDTLASRLASGGAIAACEPTVAPPICDDSSPGGSWKERSFPRHTKQFQAEVDLFMFGPGATDMVVGLAGAQVNGYADLAAALRLGPQGTFEVRDGATYRADTAVSYIPDTYRYRAIFKTNPVTKKYSVWIRRTDTETPILIAANYSFSPEQSTLASLDRVAQFMEPTGSRSVQVCDLALSY